MIIENGRRKEGKKREGEEIELDGVRLVEDKIKLRHSLGLVVFLTQRLRLMWLELILCSVSYQNAL